MIWLIFSIICVFVLWSSIALLIALGFGLLAYAIIVRVATVVSDFEARSDTQQRKGSDRA